MRGFSTFKFWMVLSLRVSAFPIEDVPICTGKKLRYVYIHIISVNWERQEKSILLWKYWILVLMQLWLKIRTGPCTPKRHELYRRKVKNLIRIAQFVFPESKKMYYVTYLLLNTQSHRIPGFHLSGQWSFPDWFYLEFMKLEYR